MSHKTKLCLIAMPRTGHRAVMRWMRNETGCSVDNVEGAPFDVSMDRARSFGAEPHMLLRDYPNWVAACLAHFGEFVNLPPMIDSWISHAEKANTLPTYFYNRWVNDGCGEGITGFPSAFDGGSVLTRYEQMRDNKLFKRYMERTDALELSNRLFPEVVAHAS